MQKRKPHPDVWPDSSYQLLKVFTTRPTARKTLPKVSPPLEKDIERKIGDYARQKGFLYIKFVSPAHRAVPDRLIISPKGTIGFLEIKRPPNKPTELQMRELTKLKGHGCMAAWCDSVDEGKAFIDSLDQFRVVKQQLLVDLANIATGDFA